MTVDRQDFDRATEWLKSAERVVVFTGAGVSVESGIPTFRDADGFWNEFPPEQYATWPGIMQVAASDPAKLTRFLLAVLEPIAEAKPNPAHRAIADLDQYVASATVVTQNIDGLHQQAGSRFVHEIHGSILETVTLTGRFHSVVTRRQLLEIVEDLRTTPAGFGSGFKLLKKLNPLIGMDKYGPYRPNIVLFGAAMAEPAWSEATKASRDCDLLICVGTSGMVYPAASIPERVQQRTGRVIGIDPHSAQGDIWLQGKAADVVPKLVQAAFG